MFVVVTNETQNRFDARSDFKFITLYKTYKI